MRKLSFALSLAGIAGVAACTVVPPNAGAVRTRAPDSATRRVWHWEATVTPVEKIEVPAPERYTLELEPGGAALLRADCNRGRGSYEIGDGQIKLGPIATTRMACPPGSLDGRYLADLARVTTFFVEGGTLYLELPMDSGTMRFGRGK
jgi:heat shock protein HslJ